MAERKKQQEFYIFLSGNAQRNDAQAELYITWIIFG